MQSPNEAIRNRIGQWAKASPALQAVRDADIRGADTARALKFLAGSLVMTSSLPERKTSGLVEQQRWFQKLRKYAAEQAISEEEALKKGMEEKSKEFKEQGAQVYAKA